MCYPFQRGPKKPVCIPYVSEYNDCNEYTNCRGCNQCLCNADAQWSCYKKRDSCSDAAEELALYDDGTEDNTVGNILKELSQTEREERLRAQKPPTHLAPLPQKRKRTTESPPPFDFNDRNVMKDLQEVLRGKRSLKEPNDTNVPIKFHHTVDELDEDTLKNSNTTGTLGVQKLEPVLVGKGSRRAGVLVNSTNNPLQIEYNHPPIYNNHITDNKHESSHNVDKYDALVNEKLHNIINYTQNAKDKELSKLVVNELKRGSETIGDAKAPVTTNITFTPEKDTLTAMAFIAGNLLNKLWNLERGNSDDSIETDKEKNQKIADLLDLFKEPLSYRQEIFLKDALQHLSEAVNKNKGIKNVSLCETMDEMKKDIIDKIKDVNKEQDSKTNDGVEKAAGNALSKLNEVLDLMKKYEGVKKSIDAIKGLKQQELQNEQIPTLRMNQDEKSSLNLFGGILEKITKLLIPNKNTNIKNKIRNQNILSTSHNLDDEVKKAFNINLDSMKLTSADKLVLDYIKRMQSNPCPSSNLPEDMSIRYKQSNILLNLSEFFKIKSYSDLIKMVAPEPKVSSTTSVPSVAVRKQGITKPQNKNSTTEIEDSTITLNDKFRRHLKELITDLIELQREKGKEVRSGEINIADALPCIVKMLNKSQPKETNYSHNALLNKIKYVLQNVKKEVNNMPLSRRSMVNVGPRPKSAVIWERLVRNLAQKSAPSRRSLTTNKPESYDVVKKMIHNIESNSSNTYKISALHRDVPASGKLMLLKTLSLNTGNYAKIIEKLLILNSQGKLPENELTDLSEFVDSVSATFDLNAKVTRSLEQSQPKIFDLLDDHNKQTIKGRMRTISDSNDNFEVTGQQALNQLMKTRVSQYMKMKESERATGDVSYDLAKKILSNLERGNDKLAEELYNILAETNVRVASTSASNSKSHLRAPLDNAFVNSHRPRFQDPTKKKWTSDDLFVKTLESSLINNRPYLSRD